MEKYRLLGNFTIQNKNNKELIIFPEVPFWFIAPRGAASILYKISDKNYEEIKEICTLEELTFTNELIDNGILTIEKKIINNNNNNGKIYDLQSVWLNVHPLCNLNCKHCFQGEKQEIKDLLSVNEIAILAKELGQNGNPKGVKINVTGGEPLLREDIIDILNAVNIDNLEPVLVTNGLFLTDDIINHLSRNKIPITISLDGPNIETHEFVRGKNTFIKTIHKIRQCVAAGVQTTISMAVHSGNQKYVIDMFELAKDLKVARVIIGFLNDFGNAANNKLTIPESSLITRRIIEAAIKDKQIFSLIQDTFIPKLILTVLLPIKTDCCGTGVNTCAIGADGYVYPCPSFQEKAYCAGNIRNRDFLEMWRDHRSFESHRSLNVDTLDDICRKCDVKYFCGGGCRAQACFTNCMDLKGHSEKCSDYKKGIYAVMWLIEEFPQLTELCTKEYQKFVTLQKERR